MNAEREDTLPIRRPAHSPPHRWNEIDLLGIAGLFVFVGTLTLHRAAPSPALTPGHLLALLVGWSFAWGMTYLILRRCRPRADLMLLPTPAMLTGWGLLILARLAPAFLLRQILWLLVGCVALVGVAVWTSLPRLLRRYRYTLLVAGTLLLGTTLILGVNPSGYGQRLWLGAYGIYFQPSELLKLLLIIYLAAYLAERRPLALHARTVRRLWMAIFGPMLTMFGMGMLFLGWQQDLGAALLFYLTFLAMLYLAWGKAWHVTLGLLLAVPIVLIGVHISSRVALRVSIWINPWSPDQADRAFQLLQSLFALAAGGIVGQGLGLGLPTLIPAVHTDFVYAALVEEFGTVGAIGLILLLALYVYRSITLAQRAEVPFESLLAGGIGAMVAIQSWVILAGATKLIPLTGVTLPFLSYGGSSLLLMMVATGIQLNLSAPHLPPLTIPLPSQTLPPLPQTAGRLGRGLLLLLLSTALSTGTWSVWRAEALRHSPQNPRHILAEARIRRGAIYDRAGRLLAGTTVDADGYAIRTYPLPEAAPVVGYATLAYGTAGIEATCNARLRGDVSRTPWAQLWDDLRHRPPVGEAVHLTLDATLQQRAQQALAGRRGAAVLLDVHSGEILALASAPTYDPATVEEAWETLRDDSQAPLLNRATQGLAQPGAILESIVLATALQRGDLPASPPALTITVALPDMTLSCSAPPTATTWTASLSATCPAPIASLAAQLGPAVLLASLDAWGLTTPPPFDLPTVAVPWPPADVDPVREALGQGELLVTPLQMALAVAAVGNDGLRLPPRLIRDNPNGCESPLHPLPTPVISPTVAAALRALWPRFDLAIGHEGTALAGPARTLTWFIGLDTPDTPRYAIAVLIEGEPPLASQIGTALLKEAATLPCRRIRTRFQPSFFADYAQQRVTPNLSLTNPSSFLSCYRINHLFTSNPTFTRTRSGYLVGQRGRTPVEQAGLSTDTRHMNQEQTMNETILLIEDDEALAQLVQLLLERAGYKVIAASNGETGLELARQSPPDLVLLDILMPDMDGWHVYEELRRITDVPVLFLTALGDEHNITYGLGLGADDYIVKPFGYKELVTRVKASLARARRARGEQTVFQTGNLWVNLDTHEVKVDNRIVSLTPTEFQLLSALIQDPGRTVSHDTLLRRVWGPEYSNRRDYLKLYIWYLRQKIEADPRNPKRIVSERGQGYRLVVEPEENDGA